MVDIQKQEVSEDYKELREGYDKLGLVLPQNVYDHIQNVDEKTQKFFEKRWRDNIKANIKHHLPKHGWINDGYADLGRDKAVIAVGAGSSLKHNEHIIADLMAEDGVKDWEEQAFITIVSNHHLRKAFEQYIPHFAIIGDASDKLGEQLDVGKDAKHTTLIAMLVVDPDVIDRWPGPVKFITGKNPTALEELEKVNGEPYDTGRCVGGAGNVLNLSFFIAIGLFRSPAWMCVGNDLSYPYVEDLEERRAGFYADGDYSHEIATKRDEAKNNFAWMGFEFPQDQIIISNVNYVDFKLFGTSSQLFVYKSWLESSAIMSWQKGAKFKIYNCSEQGILGMVLKEEVQEPEMYDEKFNTNNWYLLDELFRNKWRTYRLEKAIEEFINARRYLFGQQVNLIQVYH